MAGCDSPSAKRKLIVLSPDSWDYSVTPDSLSPSLDNVSAIGATGTKWVKMWVNWADLQPTRPASFADSWTALTNANRAKLGYLDRDIKTANDQQWGVILGIYFAFPPWAQPDPPPTKPTGYGDRDAWPADTGTDSPWGWFISYLCARYTIGAAVNPGGGPNPSPPAEHPEWARGNTTGAWINALEILTEPNAKFYPQDQSSYKTAQMMASAQALAQYWSWPAIFGPGTTDLIASDGLFQGHTVVDYDVFTRDVLQYLAGWRPAGDVYIAWSQHNYMDIENQNTLNAEDTIGKLYGYNWRGGGDRYLWMTEGGYRMTNYLDFGPIMYDPLDEIKQARLVRSGGDNNGCINDVYMSAQYLLNDTIKLTDRHQLGEEHSNAPSGIREPMPVNGYVGLYPGPFRPRPSYAAWTAVKGTDTA
jgi:hypothetical protein